MKKEQPKKPESCCQVESIVGIDERGQLVLPKELRQKAGLKPGDKLAIITWRKDGEVCCFSLVKAERLSGMVKDVLAPMVADIE